MSTYAERRRELFLTRCPSYGNLISLIKLKQVFILICGSVSTTKWSHRIELEFTHSNNRYPRLISTVWLHYQDTDKTIGEKSREELNKNAMFCFEQILEDAPPQAVRLPASNLKNHPRKTNKTYWTLQKK